MHPHCRLIQSGQKRHLGTGVAMATTPVGERPPHLASHDEAGGSVGDLEDYAPVAGAQLTDLLKVVIFQLPDLLLLREERLQTLALLLVQLQLLQLLLQRLQVGP